MDFASPLFWVALGQIIIANILLSGDNAVVIALAARSLPPQQQKQAIAIGSGAAIVMRILLTLVAAQLLLLPWLKLIGAVLLIYIGITLLLPEGDDDDGDASKGKGSMAAAVRTILIADLVMSLDNVIAVAAAAKGNTFLLVLGLAISIPLVIFGSTLLLKVIERFPLIVWLGAALLGYIAGEIAMSDPAIVTWVEQQAQALHMSAHTLGQLVGLIGAAFVVGVSLLMLRRHKAAAL
ncbi:MAG: TerC family protein [Burkholderiales bacterium]